MRHARVMLARRVHHACSTPAPAAAEALLAAGSATHDGWRPLIARQAGASEVDEALVALGAGVLLSRCRSQQLAAQAASSAAGTQAASKAASVQPAACGRR